MESQEISIIGDINERNNLLKKRQEKSSLSQNEIDKIMSLVPKEACEYIIAMDARDYLMFLRQKKGDLKSAEEIRNLISLDPRKALEYLLAMNARDDLLKDKQGKGDEESKVEISQIISQDPELANDEICEYYDVKKGDTLWDIVKKRIGSKANNKAIIDEIKFIAYLNPDVLKIDDRLLSKGKNGINSDLIYPGEKLKITGTKEEINTYCKISKKEFQKINNLQS